MQVPPGLMAPAGPSTPAADESFVVQELRSRLVKAEKDMLIICAGAAIAKKKRELAQQFEQFAREELVNATNSLNCKLPITFSSSISAKALS